LGQYDGATSEFTELLARRPNDVAAVTQLGLAEKQRGNLDAATEWFRKAVESEPDSTVGHFYLGEVLYNTGHQVEALDSLTRSTELNPDNAEAHYLIAFLLGEVGRHEEARAATKRAIQLNPSFGRAQTNLSLERYVGDRKSGPFKLPGEREAELNEAGAVAHIKLGQAFREQGYYNDALREYRLALDHGEDRRTVLHAMAEVHLLKGEYSVGLDLYETLVAEDPNVQRLWNERGVVLHQLGRSDEAILSYREALLRKPDYALPLNLFPGRHHRRWGVGHSEIEPGAAVLEIPATAAGAAGVSASAHGRSEVCPCVERFGFGAPRVETSRGRAQCVCSIRGERPRVC
jgi:tetratricopeptide (TPR) repeat protein